MTASRATHRAEALAAEPVIPLGHAGEIKRLATLCSDLHEESFLAREGFSFAMLKRMPEVTEVEVDEDERVERIA